jgi:prepilin-type N-terminal cleavage/methylation domain-containing protein
MKRGSNSDGFTLVELLIALALLGLMAVYAIQAFNAMRNMNRVAADISAQMEVDSVARLLRRELSDARAVFQQVGTGNSKLYFNGQPEALSYVTVSNGEREIAGLYYVSLRLDESGTFIAERRLLGAKPNPQVNSVILLRGLSKLQLSYAGAESNPEPQNLWSIENQLPKVVRVHIEFPKEDLRRWNEMLVKLETRG